MTDLLDELKWRGLVKLSTDEGALRSALNDDTISYYCGFDPTAPSLHHGNLVQIMLLSHLQRSGHKCFAVVGGATGLVGDPRQSGERVLNDDETVAAWSERVRSQLAFFLDPATTTIVNNYDWTKDLSAIDFLRSIGKNFRMGTMLSKDIVAKRIASDEGLSFTEFCYQVLQGYDYLHLYEAFGITLQTGGSDQWGNLTSGLDLIKRVHGEDEGFKDVHVLATPLITKADGTKFGKSEGGAIWLDPTLMSPYAFYQFWLNVEDEKVDELLRVYTFLERAEIEALVAAHQADPGARTAHRRLAEEVTRLVHGSAALEGAVKASEVLFSNTASADALSELDEATLESLAVELKVATSVKVGDFVTNAFIETKLLGSVGEAMRAVKEGGLYLNNVKITDAKQTLADEDLLQGKFALLRRGKKNIALLKVSK